MAVNLKKGQKISLVKKGETLNNLLVGLGWDEAAASGAKKGFFGSLFGSSDSGSSIDCDASVILLDENGVARKSNIVYYGNLSNANKSVTHMGDNLTGAGDGDDEQIKINLSNIPSNVHKLVFVVNIYSCKSRNQHFGMIRNAFIRLENMDNRTELARYNLSDNYEGLTSLIVGEIYRHGDEWKFNAMGQGDTATSLQGLVKKISN